MLRRSHPLVSYLDAAWILDTLQPSDCLNRQFGSDWTAAGTVSPAQTNDGFGVKGNGTDGYVSRTISVSGLPPQLMLCIFQTADASSTASRAAYCLSSLASSSSYAMIYRGDAASSANIHATIRSTLAGSLITVVGPEFVPFKRYACAFYCATGMSRLYVNGAGFSASGTPSGVGSVLQAESVGALKRTVAPANLSPDTVLFAARGQSALLDIDKTLEALLIEWTARPWHIFTPHTRRMLASGVDAGGGGGADLRSLTTLGVGL